MKHKGRPIGGYHLRGPLESLVDDLRGSSSPELHCPNWRILDSTISADATATARSAGPCMKVGSRRQGQGSCKLLYCYQYIVGTGKVGFRSGRIFRNTSFHSTFGNRVFITHPNQGMFNSETTLQSYLIRLNHRYLGLSLAKVFSSRKKWRPV
ncbi:hypothetical protein N658DRAFT_250112 [Parathielavia hyrcaniae]|uniref:Uncharacterized protein n=1 Tax=Parathielavia hyrcaniae TaxID=113614 RepID=A0AAN6T407_9PEZI|nr:hypothetical protein N658DRAFT_250112 [Parathielavia hyrcaniae]